MGAGDLVQVGDLQFPVTDEGDGRAVLLLHGFPDSRHLWRHQVPAMVDAGFRVVAPDLRGFGDAPKPQDIEAYAYQRILGDVIGILDALGLTRVSVVGADWGAGVAWGLTAFFPDRFDRLVVGSVGHPAAHAARSRDELMHFWYQFFFLHPEAEEELARDDWELLRTWCQGQGDIDRYIADLSRPGALTAGLNWYRAIRDVVRILNGAPDFPPVHAPTMGIWSTEDPFLREPQMVASDKYVNGPWRYERLEGLGHWFMLEQPDITNELLLDFLAPS